MLHNPARNIFRKIKNLTNFIPIAVFLSLISSLQFSCRYYQDDTLIKKVDSLIVWNTIAAQSLQTDINYSLRTDSMLIKIRFLNSLDTNRMSEELKHDMKEYNGIFTSYIKWNTANKTLEFDNNNNKNRLQLLKKEIISRDKKRSEYEQILKKEKINITHHLLETQKTCSTLQSVEKMYQRLNTKITSFYLKNFTGV